LIHHAARRAPASLSDRLEEEWMSDLAARPTAVSRLRFALGCCWATRVIAYELGASGAPVASAAGGDNLAIAYFHGDSGFSSRRSVTFILVVALHVAVFIGLMTNIKFYRHVTPPFETQVLTPPYVRDVPPPLPPPPFTRTRIDAPPLELPPIADEEKGSQIDARPMVQSTPADQRTEAPPHLVSHVQGGPGAGFPTADDYYPSAAKRMEEEGVATIKVCVDTKGRLTSDPSTVQTSGSTRLDQGAILLAKAGSGHYRPSTEDGHPVDSCYPFRVRFELRK
jgi:TonB family protein